MSYRLIIQRNAQKQLAAIPTPFLKNIEKRIYDLQNDPRPPGCKKLKGQENLWRIRAGEYRILYEIEDAIITVTVVEVGHRKEVYR